MVTPTPPVRKKHWSAHLAHRYAYWTYGFAIMLLSVVAAQLFYPYEHALPLARVGDVPVGGKSYQKVIDSLRQRYGDQPLTVTLPDTEPVVTSTAKVGITPHYDAATNAVTQYSRTARLVPFSFVYKLFVNRVDIGYGIEKERLDQFVNDIAERCTRSPRDAQLGFRAGQVTLQKAETGRRCTPQVVRDALASVSLAQAELTADLTPVAMAPERTDAMMQPHLVEAQSIVERGLHIASSEEQLQVPHEELASWLTVATSGEQGLRLELNSQRVRTYLKQLDSQLVIKPGVTTVTYQDGVEVVRQTGLPGRLVDTALTEERIETALFGEAAVPVAWVAFSEVAPRVQENRTYTKTAQGVQALLEQWDRANSGSYGIIVRDLSGRGLNGQLNPNRDFVTASTFKMFLAYAAFHFAEAGQYRLDDRTNTGLSVQACIDEMILHSTNECALALMDKVGWSRVHHFIRGQFPATSLDNGASTDGEKHTTVRDETAFLQRLTTGQLTMSRAHHDYLLDLMKRQIYRDGIPAGVPGVTVADKVGFYAGYKHDVAIIYGPKGPYILAVLSYGGADWRFSDLSRQVAELLAR